MQKETDHFYAAVTKVDLDAKDAGEKAGIYLTNGNQKVIVRLYTGYENGKKIIFTMDTASRSLPNPCGHLVWLKVVRNAHQLSGYYSGDGKLWTSLGAPISAVSLDKAQPNFNSWVGTSVGLFAEGTPADFDFFVCKDGYTSLPAAGCSNYFGVTKIAEAGEMAVTNTSVYGGWFMISGVELGRQSPAGIAVLASAKTTGTLEIWLDDLQNGKLIAKIPVTGAGFNRWKTFSKTLAGITGQHDVFVKFPAGQPSSIYIKSLKFLYK
jgi:hypothetical protein